MPLDPEQLVIVHAPAPVLRARAAPVERVTDEVRAVAARMVQLMHQAEGIGLAAPQVGLPWRMFVVDVPPSDEPGHERSAGNDPPTATDEPMVFINPRLHAPAAEIEVHDEGCLSLPRVSVPVRRPVAISATATGLDGAEFTLRGAGLLARCLQHEFDHLEGILIIDRRFDPGAQRATGMIQSLRSGAGRL